MYQRLQSLQIEPVCTELTRVMFSLLYVTYELGHTFLVKICIVAYKWDLERSLVSSDISEER